MIELTPAAAITLYLLFTVGAVLAVWMLQHLYQRKQKLKFTEKELRVCEYCHFAYLDIGIKKITRCPQCSSLNRSNNKIE